MLNIEEQNKQISLQTVLQEEEKKTSKKSNLS